jgi:hypothetical protein
MKKEKIMQVVETNGGAIESSDVLEKLVISGDLSKLTSGERVGYYKSVCSTLGLNPLTKPFDYIKLSGRLRLYATKDAADQLRKLHNVSVILVNREINADIDMCIVDVEAKLPDGRADFATGSVSIAGCKGDMLANAIMKCETKAKRRVTLSICGLGWTDETEVETIPNSEEVDVDMNTGEIADTDAVVGGDNESVQNLSKMLSDAKASATEIKKPEVKEEKSSWEDDFTKQEIIDIINERLKPKLDPFEYAEFKGKTCGSTELIKLKKAELAEFAESLKEHIERKQ